MTCQRMVLVVGAATMCLQAVAIGAQVDSNLQRALAAVQAGSQADAPEPYWLLHTRMGSDDVGNAVIGAVYTPFARVALAARERKMKGEALSIADAESIIADRRLYVVLRWERDLGELDPGTAQIRAMPRAAEQFSEARSLRPLSSFDGHRAAAVLGSEPPWADVGAVGVFPPDMFSPEYDFVIFKSKMDPATGLVVRRQVARARIDRTAYTRWRW